MKMKLKNLIAKNYEGYKTILKLSESYLKNNDNATLL